MSLKNKNATLPEIWAKTVIYSIIFILLILFVIIAPKSILNNQSTYELAISMSIVEEDNLLLYDYKVYGTTERFNAGLIDDVNEVKQDFQERNEIVAIKIYGERETFNFKSDYIIITSPETPALNIEYYLVKDLEFNDVNLPARTFIGLYDDISQFANNVYIIVSLITFFAILTPTTVKLIRMIFYLNNHYRKKDNKTIKHK